MKYTLAACLALILFSCSPCSAAPKGDSGTKERPTVQVQLANPKAKHNVPVIIFDGPINEDSANEFADAFGKVEPEADVVVVELTSYGGSVDDGIRMARVVERSSTPVVCVAENEAASMAYWFLQSCDVRVMTKTSMLTAHYAYFPQINARREQDIELAYKHQQAMNEVMLQQVCRRTKLTCQQVKVKLDEGDWVMTWLDAPKYGAVDKVVDSVEYVVRTLQSKGKL